MYEIVDAWRNRRQANHNHFLVLENRRAVHETHFVIGFKYGKRPGAVQLTYDRKPERLPRIDVN